MFWGAGVVTPSKPPPPMNNFCLYPPPVLRCFRKDSLMTPQPHFQHLSLLPLNKFTTPSPQPPPHKNFDHTLTFEELPTVLTEVEGTLNKRSVIGDYKELDEAMLTQSHLLYGHNFGELPDEVKDEEDENSVHKRLQYMARKRKRFWNHWVKEYLVNLRESHCNSKS